MSLKSQDRWLTAIILVYLLACFGCSVTEQCKGQCAHRDEKCQDICIKRNFCPASDR